MTDFAQSPAASQTTRDRLPSAAAALLVVALLVAVPVATTVNLGAGPYEQIARVFPGHAVAVTTTVMRVVSDAAALVSVGALVMLLFMRDGTAMQVKTLEPSFELAVLRVASRMWMLSSLGLMLFDPLDTSGVALTQLSLPGAVEYVQSAAYAPGAVAVRFVGATIVALGAHFARRWTGLLFPLLAAAWAVLAPLVVGHVLVGPDHDYGSDVAIVQVFATNALFGILVVHALRAWSGGGPISAGVRRRVAMVGVIAIPVIVVTDLVLAWFLLAGTGLFGSLTGWFIVARWVCLAVLVVVGVASTRGVPGSPDESSGSRGGWTSTALSLAALAVAGWTAVGVALSRIPTPQYFSPTSVPEIFLGFDVDAAPTAAVLFGHWRPNLLVLAIALAAVASYLVALRAVRSRGTQWPVGRMIAWVLGWGLAVFATSSGFGKYSAPHFGVHMIVHMTLSMMAPVLMVLGGFLTLLLRASKADGTAQHNLHDWVSWFLGWRVTRFLYNPLLVFAVFIGSYYGLYFSNLFGTMVQYHWAHQLMNIHFMLVGYLYYGLVIGVDRTPRPLPHVGRLGLVMAAMPFHAFFGVILMGSNAIIAATFYSYLDLPWMDLEAAQYLGGGVAWAGAEIPALVVIIVLGVQWARQDAKDAKRIDRHLDSGRDVEFEEYNRMLKQLSRRDATAASVAKEEPEQ